MQRGSPREALALVRAGLQEAPDDAALRVVDVAMLVAARDPAALDTVTELKQRGLPAPFRGLISQLWAWEAYMRDDVSHRHEAFELIELFFRATPNDLSLVDTYGHMLLWAGRDAAAEPQFIRAEAAAAAAPSSRASSACGLAMICSRRGDFASARRWLASARAHEATNMLVPRVAAIVEAPGSERP